MVIISIKCATINLIIYNINLNGVMYCIVSRRFYYQFPYIMKMANVYIVSDTINVNGITIIPSKQKIMIVSINSIISKC